MQDARNFVTPLTTLAAALGLYPFVELLINSQPIRSDPMWGYGMVGLFMQSLFFVLFAVLLLMVAAYIAGTRARARIAFWTAVVLALVIAVMTVSFTLNALQVYARVPEASRTGGITRPVFRHTTLVALIRSGMSFITLVVMAVAMRRGTKVARASSSAPAPDSMLVARAPLVSRE